MGLRYLTGDRRFDVFFKFKAGEFILSQKWNRPMNKAISPGNLLHSLYDRSDMATMSLDNPRLENKTIFNHSAYLAKHPGGHGRLQNVTQIEDCYIVFDPESPQNILSRTGLDEKLRQSFHDAQGLADLTCSSGRCGRDAPKSVIQYSPTTRRANKQGGHSRKM